ncbi:MAG: pyridoxamine 5'-phosphate oxidase [Gemmatimonadota bacterium]
MSLLSRMRLVATMGRGLVRGLPEADARRDPIELFREWWAAAEEAGMFLHERFALATATPEGRPSVRMLLLKGLDPRGFVFYTNYGSRKAAELDANPRASMCFHWGVLERQVRVEGRVERIGHEESAAYFRTRSRGSQIGAWASRQSDELADRADLEERVAELKKRFDGREVPLPDFWGGYRLAPERIEFWQGRPDRLHDRLRFEREGPGGEWTTRRLYP